jgi:glycosyltransferase involved in cell wall biosynthesis
MSKKDKRILFLATTGFASAYAGTLYFINTLLQYGFELKIVVFCESRDIDFYTTNYKNIRVFVRKSSKPILRKLFSFYRLLYIFYKSLGYYNVIITEGYYLPLSRYIKILKPSIKIIQYCQELWYSKDHPWSRQAKLFDRFSHIPDIVIDVEINRALIRKNLFKLNQIPFVLINTLPEKGIPERRISGSLSKLVGTIFPENVPIIIYTGGTGTEKPFNRLIDILHLVTRSYFFLAILNTSKKEIEEFEKSARLKLYPNAFKFCSSIARDKILESVWEADIGLIDYSYSIQPTFNQKFCAPTKLYEYMASGLAIVGSNNESLRSVIEDNKIGYCATDDSVLNFAERIDLILSDSLDLIKMKEKSQEIFKNKYCYERTNFPVIEEIIRNLKH